MLRLVERISDFFNRRRTVRLYVYHHVNGTQQLAHTVFLHNDATLAEQMDRVLNRAADRLGTDYLTYNIVRV
jgi:hypothetical protein